MESYLFQSGVAMICFYLIYWTFIRHNQHFNTNRFVILFSVLASCMLPLISFDIFNLEGKQISQTLNPIIISGLEDPAIFKDESNSYSIYAIVYIIGLMALAVRSLTGVATLVYLYWRYPKKHYHGFKAVIINGNQSPFTFFNILFINATDFAKEKVDELIVHEQTHRTQGHSIDLILMEIITIVQWFNPIIWLFKKDLKSEHEFMADEQVIKKGFDTTRYQHLLLQSNEGMALYLANNFNYSILKKRLIMMTRKKSNRVMKFKYVLSLPILLFSAVLLFVNFQPHGHIASAPDVLPVYKNGNPEMYSTFTQKLKYPKEARSKNIQGTVYVSFTVNKNGKITNVKSEKTKYTLLEEIVVVGYGENPPTEGIISDDLSILETETERIFGLLGDFTPGEKDGKPVSVRLTLPITFKLE